MSSRGCRNRRHASELASESVQPSTILTQSLPQMSISGRCREMLFHDAVHAERSELRIDGKAERRVRNLATSILTIGLNGAANLTAHSSDAVVEMYWDPRHFELFPRSTCALTLQIAAGSFGCLSGCRPPPVRTWLCLFVALYTQGTIDMIRQG